MKPIESFEAEQAFKEGKHIFVLDRYTRELIYLNECENKNFLLNVFSQPNYLHYLYESKKRP